MQALTKKQCITNLVYYCLGYALLLPFLASLILTFVPDATYDFLKFAFEVLIYWSTFFVVVKNSEKLLIKDWTILKENLSKTVKAILKNQCLMYFFNFIINFVILIFIGSETSNNQANLIEMLNDRALSTALLSILFAPLVEELVFRGSIFSLFYKKNRKLCICLASCAFGFLHVFSSIFTQDWSDLIYFFSYASMGYCLCRCYDQTKTIYGPIFLHVLNNTIGILMLLVL